MIPKNGVILWQGSALATVAQSTCVNRLFFQGENRTYYLTCEVGTNRLGFSYVRTFWARWLTRFPPVPWGWLAFFLGSRTWGVSREAWRR